MILRIIDIMIEIYIHYDRDMVHIYIFLISYIIKENCHYNYNIMNISSIQTHI